MPTKDEKETQAEEARATRQNRASQESQDSAPAQHPPDRQVMEEAKENFNSSVPPTGAETDTLAPEAPERVEREEETPDGSLTVNPGFPVGPVTLMPLAPNPDVVNSAQHIGWVRPLAMPEPMPDVTGWKSWEWAATASARDNFDRVLVRPGHVMETERDFYDAETCEKEYTLAPGAVATMNLIPTNYVNRRTRALALRVYDVTVPESLAFKLPEQSQQRQAAGVR